MREGLDLPEVALIAILDADKEGFLRSKDSLIQTMGRAARNPRGRVILYADVVTKSIQNAINETDRRRQIQNQYNIDNKITPTKIEKNVKDINDAFRSLGKDNKFFDVSKLSKENADLMIKDLSKEMKEYAKSLDFEKAALVRDQIIDIRNTVLDDSASGLKDFLDKR